MCRVRKLKFGNAEKLHWKMNVEIAITKLTVTPVTALYSLPKVSGEQLFAEPVPVSILSLR